MKICGIVAEYNPFHNGHKYQIDAAKSLTSATHVVAAMSSSFVQRGECSLVSKWARAEMAVRGGVDLVIEIPSVWSSAYAQSYAFGGVALLDSIGCVNTLCFGSECGSVSELVECKNVLNSEQVNEKLKANLEKGMSYASARAEAVGSVSGDRFFDILDGANNNLGIEYLNSLDILNSSITPITITRTGASHDSNIHIGNIASASEIRHLMLSNNRQWEQFVPPTTVDIYNRECSNNLAPCPFDKLELGILCRLRQMSVDDLAKAPDVSEGIEYRIHDAAVKSSSVEEMYNFAKTKRYTHARIRRIILHAFLGFNADDCRKIPPYIHVLAMNSKGKDILKKVKASSKLPIITKASDFDKLDGFAKRIFTLENLCTDVFSLTSPVIQPCGREKTSGIIVL